jgi:hypothetical protein
MSVTYRFLERFFAHAKQGSRISGRESPVPEPGALEGVSDHAARWFERSSRPG